ncbi:MAG TPA: hypothetical protein VGR51_06475 [Thermoplasmata archaeon]|nr:hypothetical protein [Thermoplasmata archaeon]
MANKAWVSSLSFEASFPVRGRILQAAMCECEEEGDIRVRIARDPKKGWDYDAKNADSYLDIHAFDPKGFYLKVRAGEWVDGEIVCFGYLRKVWASRIEMQGNVLMDGTRLIGRAKEVDDTHLAVDFGVFTANLGFENPAQMRKVLKGERVRDGTYVETDVDVDIEVRRHGPKDEVLQGFRRRFPAAKGRRG